MFLQQYTPLTPAAVRALQVAGTHQEQGILHPTKISVTFSHLILQQ